ncbi:hypothetical protein MSG28_015705 [Choristoneura fumiferana]|uniref:Uncharacterized protein n=1 Tax=Choristoneura fumiferana TaxID=7141 RepID=A0ACC0KBZ9_CHOFU|nr:hypothetical protein MSG28_015705 [Choristoneura fumiferana]
MDPPKAHRQVIKPPQSTSEEQAATKIQAAFRGHQTRKSISMKTSKQQQPEPQPSQAELEAEFRADDKGRMLQRMILSKLDINDIVIRVTARVIVNDSTNRLVQVIQNHVSYG